MAKRVDKIIYTRVYDADSGTWSDGSSQMITRDPAAPTGTLDNKGATTPFTSFPTINPADTLAVIEAAILAAANAQQGT